MAGEQAYSIKCLAIRSITILRQMSGFITDKTIEFAGPIWTMIMILITSIISEILTIWSILVTGTIILISKITWVTVTWMMIIIGTITILTMSIIRMKTLIRRNHKNLNDHDHDPYMIRNECSWWFRIITFSYFAAIFMILKFTLLYLSFKTAIVRSPCWRASNTTWEMTRLSKRFRRQ